MLGLAFLVIIQIMFLKGKSSDIADIIRIRYEETFVKKMPKLAEKNYKLWNCELNLRFSLECKKKFLQRPTLKNCLSPITRIAKGISWAVLQIVAGHRSLPTVWVSWLVKTDADFLK